MSARDDVIALKARMAQSIIGQEAMVERLILGLLANGHLLVLPLRHAERFDELTASESIELWTATQDAVAAITASYRPDGLNVGANLGRAAGAGIPQHLHLHVLPRWSGDTNFMTTVAGVRVMPQTLHDSWTQLHPAWPARPESAPA